MGKKWKSRNITVEDMQSFFVFLFFAVVCGVISFFSFFGVWKIESISCCPEWAGAPLFIVGMFAAIASIILLVIGFFEILSEEGLEVN